jgi:glycine C-acetyltransferase
VKDLFDKCREDGGYFGGFRVRNDMYFSRPVLEGIPGPRMRFHGKDVIVWAINNYLGLAGSEEVRKTALRSVEKWGTYTPMGSLMLTGNTEAHMELERKLAGFLGTPSSVLFNYGYLGVMGTIGAMIGPDDSIVMDRLCHASIVDGTVLASAGRRFRPFKHNDLDNLEFHLKGAEKERPGGALIVTEGVYGMRGDLADLKGICALKEKYNARLFVDDANVFAKSLPMVFVDAISKTLELIRTRPDLRQRMWGITRRLQDGLTELGYDIGDTKTPITPVYVPAGDLQTAMSMIRMLREDYGIFVSGVMYPVVPPGVVMFRMIPTAAHTEEDVDMTLAGFKGMRDSLKLDLRQKPSLKNR